MNEHTESALRTWMLVYISSIEWRYKDNLIPGEKILFNTMKAKRLLKEKVRQTKGWIKLR